MKSQFQTHPVWSLLLVVISRVDMMKSLIVENLERERERERERALIKIEVISLLKVIRYLIKHIVFK